MKLTYIYQDCAPTLVYDGPVVFRFRKRMDRRLF